MNIYPDINDPDYHIEMFWLGFKQSMINLYQHINIKYDHIQKWSNTLNILKVNKQYLEIEKNIRDYISHYVFDMIRSIYQHGMLSYHADILISNLKRWNHISMMSNFKNSNINDKVTIYSKILIIFMIYLELKKLDKYDFIDKIFLKENIQVSDILTDDNIIHTFIGFAILNNKPKILNLLKKIPNYNMMADIKKLYPNIILYDNMKTTKLIKQLLMPK
jgi:hypothetical protein